MNSRVVQASFQDENPETAKLFTYPDGSQLDPNLQTSKFIAALPEYRKYGVIASTVNSQCGYPQYPSVCGETRLRKTGTATRSHPTAHSSGTTPRSCSRQSKPPTKRAQGSCCVTVTVGCHNRSVAAGLDLIIAYLCAGF
jgi:hypothetical protein